MIAWLFLLILLIADALALRWWLRARYSPVVFNSWAVFLYSLLLLTDLILAWLVSLVFTPGGSGTLAVLSIIGVALAVVVGLFTLFFRWVIHLDLTDLSNHEGK